MIVLVKPRGPHQCTRCSGSVQALKTRLRGASKTRVMTSTRSAGSVAVLLLAAMFLLLLLQFAQIIVQTIETLLPDAPILLQPVGGVLEWTRLEPAGPPLRLTTAGDQAGALQHLEVLGDGGQAHREGRGQLHDRDLTRGEAGEDRAPGGVGEGGEGGAEAIGRHALVNLPVK